MGMSDDVNAEVVVQKPSGEEHGPYPATVTGNDIVVWDGMADIDEGDTILRALPSGKLERFIVKQANFYGNTLQVEDHYQLEVGKGTAGSDKPASQQINIQSAQGVQIGNYNQQAIVSVFEGLGACPANAV